MALAQNGLFKIAENGGKGSSALPIVINEEKEESVSAYVDIETNIEKDQCPLDSRRMSLDANSVKSANPSERIQLKENEKRRLSNTENIAATKSIWVTTAIVMALGVVVTSAFLGLGISAAIKEQEDHFERSAVDLVNKIVAAWDDYVVAAATIHGRCRTRDFTRDQFRDLYEYLVASGLDFQAAQFDPRISREERETEEKEAEEFYSKFYPEVEYRGFIGFEYANSTTLEPRSDQAFYYPIHYMEPVIGNEAAIGLDYHASGSRKETVLSCINTGRPALTDRLRLVQETEAIAYGVVLMHPGYSLSSSNDTWPLHLASIVVRIPDLLARAAELQNEGSSVYLYQQATDKSIDPAFLGAVNVAPQQNGKAALTSLPEVPIEEAVGGTLFNYREHINVTNKVWTAIVLSDDKTFKPDFVFVIIGGILMFFATSCLAVWVHMNAKSVLQRNKERAEADAEQARLILENAQQAAKAERELNDFIAHEVRNPVAAAMTAVQFAKLAINKDSPLVDDDERATCREDINIVENALKFVNDLLRNMLDMHRAMNKQLKIKLSPTDILHDVLEPVQCMLASRGSEVKVEVSCPPNMYVLSDSLRLEQVVLNLGRNSVKFVEQGFVRLVATVDEGRVKIAVEDSGPGIPEEKKRNLFKKYQESLDLLSQGTGIGLFLCKNLVELMGGEILLDESYDSGIKGQPGSRFVVDLLQPPLDSGHDLVSYMSRATIDQSAHGDGVESVSNASRQSYANNELPKVIDVLFVDDDAILRKLFARTIRTIAPEWNIREASNGETALKLVQEQDFDLIFMDMYMASVTKQLLGTETVSALRTAGVKCRICGLSANDKSAEFLAAGADVFASKPFQFEKSALRKELCRILFS